MQIEHIFSFLVYASKNATVQPEIGGTKIELKGKLYDLLSEIFEKASGDCKIDISFSVSSDGIQFNQRRNEIIDLLKNKNIDSARRLAKQLQSVTTKRSGLGLLFIVLGRRKLTRRIYLARFPADYGILAERDRNKLSVQLLERVFMKNAISYKAVVFDGRSYDSDFWVGRAIDKQIRNNEVGISGYWIRDFLTADFRTTSEAGTRRLALAIRATINETNDIDIQEELSAASRLAKSLNGELISMDNFAEQFRLSQKTYDALAATLKRPALRFEQFIFSKKEFSKYVRYRSVTINNGATLSAPIDRFDKCFTQEIVQEGSDEFMFSTVGKVVNARLKASSQ